MELVLLNSAWQSWWWTLFAFNYFFTCWALLIFLRLMNFITVNLSLGRFHLPGRFCKNNPTTPPPLLLRSPLLKVSSLWAKLKVDFYFLVRRSVLERRHVIENAIHHRWTGWCDCGFVATFLSLSLFLTSRFFSSFPLSCRDTFLSGMSWREGVWRRFYWEMTTHPCSFVTWMSAITRRLFAITEKKWKSWHFLLWWIKRNNGYFLWNKHMQVDHVAFRSTPSRISKDDPFNYLLS